MEITQKDIIANYRDANAEQDYKIRMLEAQNESLQSELDKQIKDNRKLVKALKMYADMSNWFVCYLRHHFIFKKDNYKANELAKETLKEVGEE